MIGLEASLAEQLLDVPVGQGKTQIPTHRQKDDLRFKLAPLKQTANSKRLGEASGQPITGVTAKLQHFPPEETDDAKQNLTAEDQLFILMQTGSYLTAVRGMAAPEVRTCYERAESLCHSLNRPCSCIRR